jgi:hypothetical protein
VRPLAGITTLARRWPLPAALPVALALAAAACRPRAPDAARPDGTLADAVELTWLSVSNVHVRVGALQLLADGYVTRLPRAAFSGGGGGLARSDRAYRPDSAAVARALAALQAMDRAGRRPVDLLLTGHSHFDHSFDTALWATLTGARILGARTTCFQAVAQGVPAERCTAVSGGERIPLSGTVTMWVVRWNHSGSHATNPEQHDPVELDAPPRPDPATGGLRPGVAEDFPNGGGGRAFLFVARTPRGRLSWFFQNSASAVDLAEPIVEGGVSHGAPLENLRAAMRAAGLDSVDLWIGTGGEAVAALVLPVLRPRAFLPVHWDDFWRPLAAGLSAPYSAADFEAYLQRAGVALVRPTQFLDRWRLDADGVRPVPNPDAKRALGLPAH